VSTNNAFIDTVKELSGGGTLADLHRDLTALVGEVRSSGKAGTLTLQLKVRPGKGGQTSQVFVEDTITVKTPKVEREVTVFFADDNNRLGRNDPRQPKLFGPPAEVKQFATGTAGPESTVVNQATGEIIE
jgi:hypothetical protein